MYQQLSFQEKYYISQDNLKLYYRVYGQKNFLKTPLLCLHGLTRNSKDFDKFARYFSTDRQVFCLDIRGRGRSDYDKNYQNYQIPVYVQDIMTFLGHEKINQVIAVGTSMGGLISMMLGAFKPDIFKAIILNDIGPEIDPSGLDRIAKYVGNKVILQNWQQTINGIKIVSGFLFPDYTDEDWEIFTRNSFREQDDGTIIMDYDPAIGMAMKENSENVEPVDLWPVWNSLQDIPIMILRGENSDILSRETVYKMAIDHPKFAQVTVPNRGHAPDLNEAISIQEITNFIGPL
ncbi:MAG: alpha/beta hydrolase [Emcibacter sp.]|nr:alpha/beta hydrolase [Emcibacter sp.]